MPSRDSVEIVDLKRFLQATRDSGYRNFESSIAELIDNSLQAGANNIDLLVERAPGDTQDMQLSLWDNGGGMSYRELMIALQFGGSNRFNDRTGLGRFGMGLPNSSLSQARRVEVYSWRSPKVVWRSHLDIDELFETDNIAVPGPVRTKLPGHPDGLLSSSGTLVIWSKLDRIKASYLSPLSKRLENFIGQRFRHFLWSGRRITCNGKTIKPFDPLFLSPVTRSPFQSRQYGDTLNLRFAFGPGMDAYSTIHVRFAELPIEDLADLSNDEKRTLGIVNGAGVSVVRAGREIDYGWFFLDKRRENYDDWWRCEISFSPELDEMFGVTHTKQGIRPTDELRSILTKELSPIARALNRRVQHAHMAVAQRRAHNATVDHAASRDIFLRPLPKTAPVLSNGRHSSVKTLLPSLSPVEGRQKYRLEVDDVDSRSFYSAHAANDDVIVTINKLHEFYLSIYHTFLENGDGSMRPLRKQIELFLLALGRTELLEWSTSEREIIARFIEEWSRGISIFCTTTTARK